MIYIKQENNVDKFMKKYVNFPKYIKKMLFKSKCRNGKFETEKMYDIECISLPEINDKILKNLKKLSEIRCWRNICISRDLKLNDKFLNFVQNNGLKVVDGKWLFKHMIDQIFEYYVEYKNDIISNQEVTILCNKLDNIFVEQIKIISNKVKICNVLTNNLKQYRKLEEEIYQTNGIVLNCSNNFKKGAVKSNYVINFDFENKELEKCNFSKNAYIIDIKGNKNIVDFVIDMPLKYKKYQELMQEFNTNDIYESFIYKNTSFRNIKKELDLDNAKVLYLVDLNEKILKIHNSNLSKTLDKIAK